MTPEDVAEAAATGLIFDNPCECRAWMDGTHAIYWRIPDDPYHGVTECMYCGATWGLFDHHDQPPPWQMRTTPEPNPMCELPTISISVDIPLPAKPLGPAVRERTP